MDEINTPFKRAVYMIIQSIINLDETYVLNEQFVRWRRVEEDLWSLEKLISQQINTADNVTEVIVYKCKTCGSEYENYNSAKFCCR